MNPLAKTRTVLATNSGWLDGWAGMAFWLVASALVAGFGGQFQPGEWYGQLIKPEWTPPGWLFGPVWTLLYIAMAIAVWLVWRTGGWRANRAAVAVYVAQLVLNAAWSWIFFGERLIGLALVDIILLWLAILLVMVLFWRRRALAGFLFLPYVLWVGFATALNFRLWTLN